MKILNKKLRQEFARPGRCEWCLKFCRKREPHHLRTRTPELTVRINLFSVGSTPLWCCACHTEIGNGKIDRSEVLSRVAIRERVKVDDISACMDLFRRLVRPTPSALQASLASLAPSARVLAERELSEARIPRIPKTSH